MVVSARNRGDVTSETYAGLFLVTAATLMLEIGLTRIFSVMMWYHFAFVAISVALFGMTVGALIVHLLPDRFPQERVHHHLWRLSLLLGVSMAVSFAVQLRIRFIPRFNLDGIVSVVLTCAVVAVPFIVSGIIVCLALTRFPGRVNRLYAADLVGAAVGCVALVVLFSWLDGPSVIVLVAAVAALGALVFAVGAGDRRGMALAGSVAALLVAFGLVNGALASGGDAPLRMVWAKGQRDGDHLYERWNAFSRLTVDGDPDRDGTDYLNVVIDSTAGTGIPRIDGDVGRSDERHNHITNLAHHVRDDADVLVVGAGGGSDVLSSLQFDQRSVTGVEINGDILDIATRRYGDFSGHLDRDPRVRFVNDEARSYLAREDAEYDIIQISLIDTWAASSAGAFALSENGLYTTEAWDLFLDRLRPGGVLSVSRYFTTPGVEGLQDPLESYRLVALAAQAVHERGASEPRDHLLMYRTEATGLGVDLATLLVSPEPFSRADAARADDRADRYGFLPVLTPTEAPDTYFADLAAPGGPGPAVDDATMDISPPTDDRPFFFQMVGLRTFLSSDVLANNLATRPVLVLALLGLTVLALAASCVAVPLLIGRRRRRRLEAGSAPPGGTAFYTYFAGIGFGFLLIEMSQLQRLNLFLGHPTYSLTVVLFSVLIFSGLGSMASERVLRRGGRSAHLGPLVALLVAIVAFGLLTPAATHAADGATTPARIALAVALLAPLAVLMGMPFAVGMHAAAGRPGTPTAFLWGINGATSVCGSVLGVVIALFLGVSMAFWAGALAYVVALVSMVVITRRSGAGAEEVVIDLREPATTPPPAVVAPTG